MKYTKIIATKINNKQQLWLLGITASLMAIIMTVTWKSGEISQLGMSLLFYLAVGSIIWDKRHELILKSDIFSRCLGILLIAYILWQSVSLTKSDLLIVFTRLSPLICAIAVGLLASGWRGLKQYWREITILFFLGVPELVLLKLIDVAPLTAKFSTFLLWYSGFDVSLQKEIYINLGTQTVKVAAGCSGVGIISYLLGVAMIALLMFPIEEKKRIIVPIIAILLGFVANSIRVAILVIIVLNKQAFDYWHEGEGSRLFGMFARILGLIYFFMLQQGESKNQSSPDS